MRVEYTEPSPSEPDFPAERPIPGTGTAVRDQELPPRPKDERHGAESRTTVG
jgi:hypothetical protein